jgi:exodeoxyribonuclease V alpha subunit
MHTTLRGTITRFRYKSDNSSFKICEFEPEDPKDGALATLKGLIDQSNLGMSVTLKGEWVDDPKYGRQFVVDSCMRNKPTTLKSMVQWLVQQKGIGPKTAEAIGNRFGDQLRQIIETDWQKLTDVKRVSKFTADEVHEAWEKDELAREVQLLLMQGNLPHSENVVRKVIRRFGQNAIARIMDNPYRLTEIPGIGFKTADTMARQMGWSPQRPERVEAAMAHLLQEAADDGHSFLHRGELIDAVRKLASIEFEGKTELLPEKDAVDAIDRVVDRGDVFQEKVTIAGQENLLCYLPYYHDLEVTAAKRISDLQSLPHVPPNNIGKILKKVEAKLELELSPEQRDAVLQALTHNCSVITGLPGTGKTSTVRALIQVAAAIGLTTMVAAPTGRAAKRLQEVTGWDAKTIHRTLGYVPKLEEFTFNEKNPLPCDMLIVDEASMLDLELMVAILKAVPDTCSVVWIGDINQLPSIGAGMVLRDLINSNRVHTTILDKIFRQAEGSLIIQNAHRIFRGEMPKFPGKGTEADSYMVPVPKGISEISGRETDSIEFVKETLPKLYKRLKERFNYDPIKDIQVLTPMRVGPAGYLVFNEIIQSIVNPDGERIEIGGQVFRLNDRVMQIVNDYKLDVYNGDVGFIKSVSMEDKVLEIEFLDQTVLYPFDQLSNLTLSYASSVHKSQGSEFKAVILILLSHHWVMLDRNIIYTANTRARKMAIYLASRGAVETAVRTQKVLKRNSLLALRLRATAPRLEEQAA